MDNKARLAIAKERLNKLQNNGRNEKTPGVIRKLIRQIRLIENKE